MCNVHFILTLTPPWLQVKVTKYFDFVNYFCWRVVVCVRFSSELLDRFLQWWYQSTEGALCRCATCTSFWPWPPPWLQVKVTKYFDFVNYSHFSNDDTNQLREQCRCATCTSFWPWPLHDCRSRSQNLGCCLGMNADICRGPYKVTGDRLDLVFPMFDLLPCVEAPGTISNQKETIFTHPSPWECYIWFCVNFLATLTMYRFFLAMVPIWDIVASTDVVMSI